MAKHLLFSLFFLHSFKLIEMQSTSFVLKISMFVKTNIGEYLAAVSFLHSAWVWLDRIDWKTDGTGLGTGFISYGFLDVVVCGE